jgi:hypothetical protein
MCQWKLEESKTYFMFNNFFPLQKSCLSWDCRKMRHSRKVTDDNLIPRMRFACWMLKATDTLGVRYCFSTATVIMRTHCSVTLPLRCLYCCSEICTNRVSTLWGRNVEFIKMWILLVYTRRRINRLCMVNETGQHVFVGTSWSVRV